MQITELAIAGAYRVTPRQLADDRGVFQEVYKEPAFVATVGHRLDLKQANCSVSKAGVVRGIHFASVPPSQAKYVMCLAGAVLDVAVDIRTGSPTYGRWAAVRLDDRRREAVYVSAGLGHAFMALTDDAVVMYLCSEGYAPEREHAVHPLDPAIGIDWGTDLEPLLSPKDAAAPTLAQAADAGLLPSYDDCLAFRASLASRPG